MAQAGARPDPHRTLTHSIIRIRIRTNPTHHDRDQRSYQNGVDDFTTGLDGVPRVGGEVHVDGGVVADLDELLGRQARTPAQASKQVSWYVGRSKRGVCCLRVGQWRPSHRMCAENEHSQGRWLEKGRTKLAGRPRTDLSPSRRMTRLVGTASFWSAADSAADLESSPLASDRDDGEGEDPAAAAAAATDDLVPPATRSSSSISSSFPSVLNTSFSGKLAICVVAPQTPKTGAFR